MSYRTGIMAMYRLQIRQFEELRQWTGPKNIRFSRAHFSPWKTIARSMNLHELQGRGAEATRTGLKQWRIVFGRQTILFDGEKTLENKAKVG